MVLGVAGVSLSIALPVATVRDCVMCYGLRWLRFALLNDLAAGVHHVRGVLGGGGGLGAHGGGHLLAILGHHGVLVCVRHLLAHLPGSFHLPWFAVSDRGEGAARDCMDMMTQMNVGISISLSCGFSLHDVGSSEAGTEEESEDSHGGGREVPEKLPPH